MANTTKANVLLIASNLAQKQSDEVTVSSVENDTLYTVTINSNAYTYTSDADATEAEIITGLTTAINAGADLVTATDGTTKITLLAEYAGRAYTLVVDSNLATTSIAEESTLPDDVWILFLADVVLSISTDIVPEEYQELIQRYLLAHKLTEYSNTGTSNTTGGPVKRERVGDVEREYGVSSGSTSAEMAFGSTKYGLEFMRLYKKYRYVRFI